MLFDLLEESKRIIGIRSDGEIGNRDVVERLAPYCKQLGFDVSFQLPRHDHTGRELNLIAHTSRNGTDLCPGGIALVTHLDTVPAGDPKLWTKTSGDPFGAHLEGDSLYGLGSADTKLDFLCKLLAIDALRRDSRKDLKKVFQVPLALVGTFGEERALAGARLIRESKVMSPRWALVSEPSELKAVVAHKGIIYMKMVFEGFYENSRSGIEKSFQGKAAHGSMPHLGENAIEKAMRWVVEQKDIEIEDLQGGVAHNIVPERCDIRFRKSNRKSEKIEFIRSFLQCMEDVRVRLLTQNNPSFDPPNTTDNIGVSSLQNGNLEILFDFRLIPETDGQEIAAAFRKVEKEISRARLEVIRSNAPMNTSTSSEISDYVRRAHEAIGMKTEFLVKSGNTEGAIFSEMGIQTIVIGPGKSVGNIHAPNEHNEISQMTKAVAFYSEFLKQFC